MTKEEEIMRDYPAGEYFPNEAPQFPCSHCGYESCWGHYGEEIQQIWLERYALWACSPANASQLKGE